jgi:hypothetical protein
MTTRFAGVVGPDSKPLVCWVRRRRDTVSNVGFRNSTLFHLAESAEITIMSASKVFLAERLSVMVPV